MTAKDIAVRTGDPAALAEYGIRVVEQPGGYRAIGFDDNAHAHFNVLTPTIEVSQENAYIRPILRLVQLDTSKHCYTGTSFLKENDQFALNKLGLYALAEAMGIDVGGESAAPIPPALLGPQEIGWNALVTIRRSDGTERRFEDSHVFNYDDAKEEIEAQVRATGAKYNHTNEKMRQSFESRWQAKKKHARQLSRTMAIERALRSALGVKHVYTAEELRKPFAVVAYALNMDNDDVKNAAIERAFGPSSPQTAARALEAPVPLEEQRALVPPAATREPTSAPAPAAAPAGPGTPEPGPAAAAHNDLNEPPDPEPAYEFKAPPTNPAIADADEAGLTLVQFGKYGGPKAGKPDQEGPMTIKQIAEQGGSKGPDPGYVKWLADMDARTSEQAMVKDAARVYADVFLGGLGA